MVVTPKANDLTGRKDSRGYTMGTLVGLGFDQVATRRSYELAFLTV